MYNVKECRQYIRFNVPIKVTTKLNNQDIVGFTENISMGGAKVVFPQGEFVKDSHLEYNMYLPNLPPLEIIAQIVWVDNSHKNKILGTKFVIFSDKHKEQIYNYIFNYCREEVISRWWQDVK